MPDELLKSGDTADIFPGAEQMNRYRIESDGTNRTHHHRDESNPSAKQCQHSMYVSRMPFPVEFVRIDRKF